MQLAIKLIYTVGFFFIMMIPGIILKKCKLSTDGFGKGLSNLILYIAQPVLIFKSYIRAYDSGILLDMLYVLIFSFLAHVIFAVIAMLSFKDSEDGIRRMLRFATVFSNAAFMGMPLIEAVLGTEALIYASVYNISFNGFLWTLGVYICTAKRDIDGDGRDDGDALREKGNISVLKTVTHPTMVAAALGLVYFFLPLDAGDMPSLLMDVVSGLSNLVAPLSMIVLGLRLAEIDLRGFFKEKNLYVFILLRHLALPALIFAVMRVVSLITYVNPDVITSVLIMAAAPAATSATMFAEKYDCDAKYVSKVVAVSTILSIATMPLVSLLTMI